MLLFKSDSIPTQCLLILATVSGQFKAPRETLLHVCVCVLFLRQAFKKLSLGRFLLKIGDLDPFQQHTATRSPSSALLPFLGGEGSPTKIDVAKTVGSLILTSKTGGPRPDSVRLKEYLV